MVSNKLLKELRLIIKEEYGFEIKPKEASDIGNTLVGFFELLMEVDSDKHELKEGVVS